MTLAITADRAKAESAAIAGRLPPLLIAAERIAATVTQGVHGRRRVGSGDVFWQHRPYYPGDELKQLDWRQSAKSDKIYLRQMEWSAAQTVYLWCDLSPSMDYASRKELPTKAERSMVLLLALSSVLSRAGERVALMGDPEPPISGRAVAERLADRLQHRTQVAQRSTGDNAENERSLPPPVLLPAHAHAVMISDFLSPIDEFRGLLERFAARDVRGHLLQVLDPAEVAMPFLGRVRFRGMEREGELLMSRVESIRDQYLNKLDAHREELRTLARHAGWSFSTHATDAPGAPALLALYQWLAADKRFRA
ncbi:DUF58 domain-containing protein [Dongia sedimenti]|uniref:DUF58 domain-containing protein n=1 Tax=Dongia sedimenti TaxID=3064282 RepID=A0ABU0YTV1_9PROT|nr:DUF58 domain-containing protein [Rhodospirillaceae bacterium R-7]